MEIEILIKIYGFYYFRVCDKQKLYKFNVYK